jgi:plastocyanin
MPSARFHEAGSLGFNWSHIDPYLRGSIVAYPFDWFEASYQYTDVNNALYSDIAAFSGNQSYKDKSFDAKLRIFREGEFMPAVAIGARDLAGTGVFSSEYLVASKKIGPVDLTLGLGWGTLSRDKLSNPLSQISDEFDIRTLDMDTRGGEFNVGYFFSGNMGVFGGAEILIPNMKGLRFKIEYDATDYNEEGFAFGQDSFKFAFEPVKGSESRLNIGLNLDNTTILNTDCDNLDMSNILYVTSNDNSDYTVVGKDSTGDINGADPDLNFNVGDAIYFYVNANGNGTPHYFHLKDQASTGTGNQISPSGTYLGLVIWKPDTAGTYYYQCRTHSGHGGQIIIAN